MEREDSVRELLAQLNRWAQMTKTSQSGDPLSKDKGEANARIADLKAQLQALGAVFHWDGRQYVMDRIVEADQGYQAQDAPASNAVD